MELSLTLEHSFNLAGSACLLGSGIFMLQSESDGPVSAFLSDAKLYFYTYLIFVVAAFVTLASFMWTCGTFLIPRQLAIIPALIVLIPSTFINCLWIFFEPVRLDVEKKRVAAMGTVPSKGIVANKAALEEWRKHYKTLAYKTLILGSLLIFIGSISAVAS